MNWVVYILRCFDDTFYTGITNNLDKRIEKHNKGTGAKYTRGRTPVSLVRAFACQTKGDALRLEHKIKKLSKEEKLNYPSKVYVMYVSWDTNPLEVAADCVDDAMAQVRALAPDPKYVACVLEVKNIDVK